MGVAVNAAQAQRTLTTAMHASPKATLDGVNAFATIHFRQDLAAVHVPALAIHGDNDQSGRLPAAANARRNTCCTSNVIYAGTRHGLHFLNKGRLSSRSRRGQYP